MGTSMARRGGLGREKAMLPSARVYELEVLTICTGDSQSLSGAASSLSPDPPTGQAADAARIANQVPI
jgi:hypothetical protein